MFVLPKFYSVKLLREPCKPLVLFNHSEFEVSKGCAANENTGKYLHLLSLSTLQHETWCFHSYSFYKTSTVSGGKCQLSVS